MLILVHLFTEGLLSHLKRILSIFKGLPFWRINLSSSGPGRVKVRYRSGEGQVGQSQVCVMFYYHNKTKDNKNSDISGQEIQFL